MTWIAIAFLAGLNLGFPLGWWWAGWLQSQSREGSIDREHLRHARVVAWVRGRRS